MNYSYGNSDWKDLLTGYNGTAISYDLSGNPLNWRNASSLTWDGRRLSGMTLTDGTELAFEYNSDGLRTGKTVGNSTVQYIWNEGNLIAEIRDGYTLKFLYNNGEAAGFSYNGADYYYGKDSFGVIRYLYNTSGEVVTTYTYDAWGTVLSVTGTLAETVGTVNPVRYKSYYLDSETSWYYLQSRYYDPVVGRFLNADEVLLINQTENSIKGTNAFGYCYNDPIRMYDISGTEPGYINDQEDPSVAKIKWGLLGNTKYNGCGWVAVYNVMHSYSSKITYNYVIRHLDLCGGVLALGKLGASPSGITAFLNTRFWTVNRIGPITRWWGMLAEMSGAVIVLYQHKGWKSSLHYVAGIKTGEGVGGRFRFYNDYYYTKAHKNASISIWDYIDLLKKNGCKLLMIWGVATKAGRW